MLRAMLFSVALVALVLLGSAAAVGAASKNTIADTGGKTGAPAANSTPVPGGPRNVPQPVPSCPAGINYAVAGVPGKAAVDETTTKSDTGNHCDDCLTGIKLPFSQSFYGETFTSANVSSNGVLYFTNSQPATGGDARDASSSRMPAPGVSYAIMPYWQDLTTAGSGDGIYTSVSGESPNRVLHIHWNAHSKSGAPVSFEVRLYEGQDRFSIAYKQVADGGQQAIIGAQGGKYTKNGRDYVQEVSFSFADAKLGGEQQIDFDRTTVPCICDPTACETPTRTETPSATPTETCGINPVAASASCSPPGSYYYTFGFYSTCQVNYRTGNYTVQFQVATGPGGPWSPYDTQLGTANFPPSQTAYIYGSLGESNIPTEYQYFRVSINVLLEDGYRLISITPSYPICRAPTATVTETDTPTSTPTSTYTRTATVTNTPTITQTPCSPAVEQIANGGFEMGSLSGWSISVRNAGTQLPHTSGGGHQGAYHADLTANDINYPTRMVGIGQNVYVPPQGGTLGFWVSGTCFSSCYARLEINGVSVTQLAAGSGWQYQTFDLTGYVGQFVNVAFWAGAASISIDDVSFVAPGPCYTPTATSTVTSTATPTEPPALVGHVTWQGAAAQPSVRQQQPITLTLKSGGTEVNYLSQTTDASGFFTVPLGTLPGGTYVWRAKGPKFLANSGTIGLTGSNPLMAQVEIGLMRAGDCNNDNTVNATDFNILKNVFGKSLGDPGYDPRADLNNDNTVSASDFNVLKGNFGTGGAPAIRPGGP